MPFGGAIHTIMSDSRSGNSFQKPPSGLARPASIATMPSNRLHSSRSWHSPAPASSHSARAPPWLSPARHSASPASTAASRPSCEIRFGVMPVPASQRLTACAQPVWRLASGRRLPCGALMPAPDARNSG